MSNALSQWSRNHGDIVQEPAVRLDDELAADTEALALREAAERRQKDPAFRRRVRQIIEEDRVLLERLAKRASRISTSRTSSLSPRRSPF